MMFSFVVALSLLTATLGLQIEQPTEAVRSSSPITITWTSEPDDPPFSVELVNDIFNNQFAIANNVQPSLGTLELTLPQVPPGDGYTIQFVNISDIDDVYTETSSFSVAEPPAPSVTPSTTGTTGAPSSGTTSGASTTRTVTSPSTSRTVTGSNTGTGTETASAAGQTTSDDGASTLSRSGLIGGVGAGFLAWLLL